MGVESSCACMTMEETPALAIQRPKTRQAGLSAARSRYGPPTAPRYVANRGLHLKAYLGVGAGP
jgi:hypothetical protein